jgi:Protein of unknown function (DUF3106)
MTRLDPNTSFLTLRAPFAAMLLALALCVPVGSALAQQGPPPPRDANAAPLPAWEQLTPAQREALIATLRDRWNQNPQQRARIMNHAQRWRQMTPEQRQRAAQGKRRWDAMTPQQRATARAAFEQGKSLSPEQRAALREKLKAMTPEQRREWLKQHRGQSRNPQHHGQGPSGPGQLPPPPPPPPQEPRP